MTPDIWLPSQLQGITTRWLVPNYTAWWQRHTCVNNLPRVALNSERLGFEPATCWWQVQHLAATLVTHNTPQHVWCVVWLISLTSKTRQTQPCVLVGFSEWGIYGRQSWWETGSSRPLKPRWTVLAHTPVCDNGLHIPACTWKHLLLPVVTSYDDAAGCCVVCRIFHSRWMGRTAECLHVSLRNTSQEMHVLHFVR